MSSESFNPPRGMRDFYPEDMALRDSIFRAWRSAAGLYGFVEYDSCVVEHLDLLKRKAGEEIVEQIYSFTDKSGRDLALRPELTPTLARMIAARFGSLSFPVKWFAIAQCFRYERSTRGRKREHYQWNMDIIGEDSVSAEAEVVAAAAHALDLLGLEHGDYNVHFNSRQLLSDLLESVGIPRALHAAVFAVLDKRHKTDEEKLAAMFSESGLSNRQTDGLFGLIALDSVEKARDALGANTDSSSRMIQFSEEAARYGLADRLKFDISVVRGLSYYTGTVFEAFDSERRFRAIFGGGRYNNLLGDIGRQPAPGVGLGFGDVVIAEFLADTDRIPRAVLKAETAMGYMDGNLRPTAVALANMMRSGGKSVDLALVPEKARTFFSRAGKGGYREAVYLGPDDAAAGKVRVKNLADRGETEIPLP